MRLDLTGRNVEITPVLRQLLSRKLSRIERLIGDSALSAQVVLTRERYRHITDITLHARGDHMLTGVGASTTGWPASVSEALVRITQQAQRLKEKWTTSKRRRVSARTLPVPSPEEEPPPADSAPQAARVRYPVRRHTLRAAIARLQKSAEPFVLFRHDETMRLSVVFRRKDGSVALIDPEA